MAEIFIATVVQKVANLAVDSLVQETYFLRGVRQQVELINSELRRLQAFLKDADTKWREGNASVKNWVRELRDVASEAENVLEVVSYTTKRNKLRNEMKKGFSGALLRYACKPSDLIKLHRLGVKIQQINRNLCNIFDSASKYGIVMKEERSEHEILLARRQVSPDSEDDVDVIGFDNYRNQIVKQLVNPRNQSLTVVTIVGMGGIGKSTLARKVYNDPQVKQYFNSVVVWVAVSQKYEVHDLLKEIKKKIMGNESTSSEEDTRRTLRDFLKVRRYLIVLDDVWETTTWDQLQGDELQVAFIRVFPEANNGSRIVLTTRNLEVAKHPNQKREIHELKLLGKENSWKLLRSKAFPSYQDVSDSTKNQLEDLGRKLAEKCEGLPLALVILGGYLSKNLNYHQWSNLVASVDWEVTDKGKKLEGVLARSYRDLPQHYLRACFLYIASFPEDYTIPASKLIALWIAEGFVPHRQGHKTLEDTAREILEELAQRCMVQVAERSIAHGWIDSIRIHDVLRDWAISEGRIDGFVNVWSNNQDVEASGSNAMPAYRVTLMNNFFQDQFSAATPKLRTILAFKLSPNLVSQIGRLRFLRVLLLENLPTGVKFPKEMKGMIHLRYLGLRHCSNMDLPSSMWRHLLNLQTLDATGTSIRFLPSSFWDIPTLRNVYLDGVTFPISPKPNCQRSLQTLHITAEDGSSDPTIQLKSLVGKTPLVSLMLRWAESSIPSEVLSGFLGLHQLSLRGSLKKLPDVNLLPQNLRELKLAKSKLEEDPMPILEKLPSLVLLQLLNDAYEGSSMRCSSDGFRRLQRLTLSILMSVTEWTVEVGAMPNLTHLKIDTLPNLKMVPEEGLQRLMSLKQLTLRDSLFTGNFKELEEKGCKAEIIPPYYGIK